MIWKWNRLLWSCVWSTSCVAIVSKAYLFRQILQKRQKKIITPPTWSDTHHISSSSCNTYIKQHVILLQSGKLPYSKQWTQSKHMNLNMLEWIDFNRLISSQLWIMIRHIFTWIHGQPILTCTGKSRPGGLHYIQCRVGGGVGIKQVTCLPKALPSPCNGANQICARQITGADPSNLVLGG